jgi:hypothetical protein
MEGVLGMPKDKLPPVRRLKRERKPYRPVGVREVDQAEQWQLRKHGHVRFEKNFGPNPADTADDYRTKT